MTEKPDLRVGPPEVHDLIAAIDEAIDAGDEARVEELSRKLRALDEEFDAPGPIGATCYIHFYCTCPRPRARGSARCS